MAYGTVSADVIQSSVTGVSLGAGNATRFKSRIINGDMRIDQRNAGAAVTITNISAITYTLDRWYAYGSVASKFSVQQNAGSVTPPAGFINYLGVTSLSAYTVGATDGFQVGQIIEGLNVADLGWGTANAKTITLSFWVYSSLTGTFGGVFQNSATSRSYPFTYTISSASTWTQISITIAGDTSGTWLTTNGVGVYVKFGLGVGTTYSGTAGAWAAANYVSATGAVSVVGTNGATFYITGVQLEVGSSATGFEYVDYTTQLAMCQRYLPCFNFSASNSGMYAGQAFSTTNAMITFPFEVQTRTAPTGIAVIGTFNSSTAPFGNSGNYSSLTFFAASLYTGSVQGNGGSGLTAGNATLLLPPAGTSQIQFTGCEL
jgi:hypothetical protein